MDFSPRAKFYILLFLLEKSVNLITDWEISKTNPKVKIIKKSNAKLVPNKLTWNILTVNGKKAVISKSKTKKHNAVEKWWIENKLLEGAKSGENPHSYAWFLAWSG